MKQETKAGIHSCIHSFIQLPSSNNWNRLLGGFFAVNSSPGCCLFTLIMDDNRNLYSKDGVKNILQAYKIPVFTGIIGVTTFFWRC